LIKTVRPIPPLAALNAAFLSYFGYQSCEESLKSGRNRSLVCNEGGIMTNITRIVRISASRLAGEIGKPNDKTANQFHSGESIDEGDRMDAIAEMAPI
jgi:hypothetical protein